MAQFLRAQDRGRFLTLPFAPADRRGDLLALYAFNLEIAKTREAVREAMLGRIRLQWWREALDEIDSGAEPRRHEVVQPLAETIRRHALPRVLFDRLIDAREADLDEEPPATLDALEAYAGHTAGGLVELALDVLSEGDAAKLAAGRMLGTAQGLAGVLVALPFRVRLGRLDLPHDVMTAAGLDPEQARTGRSSPELVRAVTTIADKARETLAQGRKAAGRPSRETMAAHLAGRLAARTLKRLAAVGHDPYDKRLGLADPWAMASLAWGARIRRP